MYKRFSHHVPTSNIFHQNVQYTNPSMGHSLSGPEHSSPVSVPPCVTDDRYYLHVGGTVIVGQSNESVRRPSFVDVQSTFHTPKLKCLGCNSSSDNSMRTIFLYLVVHLIRTAFGDISKNDSTKILMLVCQSTGERKVFLAIIVVIITRMTSNFVLTVISGGRCCCYCRS